jgi:hypothetical protein
MLASSVNLLASSVNDFTEETITNLLWLTVIHNTYVSIGMLRYKGMKSTKIVIFKLASSINTRI